MTLSTRFDMASCSKVMGTTTAAAILYQRGLLNIFAPATSVLGSAYGSQGKSAVSIVDLLTHSAGYPGDPAPGYWEQSFGCPNHNQPHPAQDFSCTELIYHGLLNQTLINVPGSVYLYSDLSFITLQYVVGTIVYRNDLVKNSDLLPACRGFTLHERPGGLYTCYFEAFVRSIFSKLNMPNTGYLPRHLELPMLPPTRNDTWYRFFVSQGTVDDENCYANGGIAGHAGIFSNLQDIVTLLQSWLYVQTPSLLNATTVSLWTREYNHSVSCRALGWSTNDQTVPDRGWDGTCGPLSSKTFLHVGYTGTQICADPEHGVYTVLLTNRVYPSGDNIQIRQVRVDWNTAVVAALGLSNKKPQQQQK